MLANRLGQRAVADLPIEDLLELHVPARDRIADDDELEIAGDVLRRVAGQRRDPLGREKVAHRRVDVLIGALDVEPLALQHRRERRHRRAADPDQVNLHSLSFASRRRPGRGRRSLDVDRRLAAGELTRPPILDDETRPASAITRAVTPNGSVIAGVTVWPEGKPITTGPGKSANSSAITARAVGSPDGSSHLGSSPMTTAEARASRPGLPQLRHHAIQPVRALADLVEKQHVARRRRESERRAERREELRQRPAEERAGRLPVSNRFEPGRRELAHRLAPAERGHERVRVVALRAAAQPAGEHRAVKRDDVAAEREERQHRRQIAVADERLAGAPAPRHGRAAAAPARCRSRRARR